MSSSILTLRNSLFSPTTNANSNSVGFPTSKTPTTNNPSRNVLVLKIEANKNKYESDEEAFVREGSEQDVNQTKSQTKSQTKKRLMKIPMYASMNPIKTTRILRKKTRFEKLNALFNQKEGTKLPKTPTTFGIYAEKNSLQVSTKM